VAEFARDLGVDTALTFGAFVGAVSHRSIPIMRRTPNEKMDAWTATHGYDETPNSGPTAFVTALLHAFEEHGIPAVSLWAAAPAYLGAPNPSLSLALLEAAERLGRLIDLDPNDLTSEADAPPPDSTSPELPSGRDLVEDLERFLRDQRND
jgi:hypothetical protein